ncbi:MAG TPA: hypothetical protein VJQ53_08395 [Candidatus Eisenbacteria bacterium]|nr:hypothetical protein [Candidatus Eisenbacteria bacterium]
MSFGSSPVNETLEAYVAGRVNADRLVIAVAAAYYGREGVPGIRDGLGPLIEIIDRASPGIVELGGDVGRGQGFDIRLAERSFPTQYEQDLRRAVEAYLASHRTTGVIEGPPAPPASPPGAFARLLGAIRRLFSASA